MILNVRQVASVLSEQNPDAPVIIKLADNQASDENRYKVVALLADNKAVTLEVAAVRQSRN